MGREQSFGHNAIVQVTDSMSFIYAIIGWRQEETPNSSCRCRRGRAARDHNKRNRARPCTTVQECDKPFTRIHGKSMTLLEITGIEVFSGAYFPEPQFSLPLFSEPQFE
jgi:hypothetical protein